MSEIESKSTLTAQQNIRRRLLTAAVYTPPAILGTMMVGPRHALGAWGQVKTCTMNPGPTGIPTAPVTLTISSGASACCPCVPGSTKAAKANGAQKCAKMQCVKSCAGNTAACAAAGGLANIGCDNFCQEGPPGCMPPVGCKQACNCPGGPQNPKLKTCN